jgi:putative tryptophan/tyrosine transport system substrate-binding protein
VDRRRFLLTSLAGALAPLDAGAQDVGKVYRIGYLGVGRPEDQPFRPVFEQALRDRGWVLGQNLVITYRFAEEKYDRLPALAAELVRVEPQVIVTVTTLGTLAAKNATSTIPIVMWGVGDPVGQGLVASFARPGGNVTGFTDTPSSGVAKQLHSLKEAVPRARRLALLTNPANQMLVKTVEDAAATLGVELQIVGVKGPEEIEPSFRAMAQVRVEGLLVMDDATFFRHLGRIAELALRQRLPTICGNWNYAKVGGLMNYSVNRADTVRQVAGYVDRLLRGARPADLPVEQPTKFDLVINFKTAKALGLTIPPSLLARADQIIE